MQDKLLIAYLAIEETLSESVAVLIVSNVLKFVLKPFCHNAQSVNKASIGNDLVLDNYVRAAISKTRVIKRVPEDRRVSLAEILSYKKMKFFTM